MLVVSPYLLRAMGVKRWHEVVQHQDIILTHCFQHERWRVVFSIEDLDMRRIVACFRSTPKNRDSSLIIYEDAIRTVHCAMQNMMFALPEAAG